MEMCSLELISFQPAMWTSKLRAITVIIWMMFYHSLAVDRDMSKDSDGFKDDQVLTHQTHAWNIQSVRNSPFRKGRTRTWKEVPEQPNVQHITTRSLADVQIFYHIKIRRWILVWHRKLYQNPSLLWSDWPVLTGANKLHPPGSTSVFATSAKGVAEGTTCIVVKSWPYGNL